MTDGPHQNPSDGTNMTLLKRLALVTALGLVLVDCTPVKPDREAASNVAMPAGASSGTDPVTARMDAKWVSAIRGMKLETPDGALVGRVQEVVIDGYGRPSFAIVSYGGLMGFGIKYTAIPWVTVAEMLDKDRLLVDRSNLESAPLLSSATPQSGDRGWRRRAESYWNAKVAVAK